MTPPAVVVEVVDPVEAALAMVVDVVTEELAGGGRWYAGVVGSPDPPTVW